MKQAQQLKFCIRISGIGGIHRSGAHKVTNWKRKARFILKNFASPTGQMPHRHGVRGAEKTTERRPFGATSPEKA
jgi:hypothetical protein